MLERIEYYLFIVSECDLEELLICFVIILTSSSDLNSSSATWSEVERVRCVIGSIAVTFSGAPDVLPLLALHLQRAAIIVNADSRVFYIFSYTIYICIDYTQDIDSIKILLSFVLQMIYRKHTSDIIKSVLLTKKYYSSKLSFLSSRKFALPYPYPTCKLTTRNTRRNSSILLWWPPLVQRITNQRDGHHSGAWRTNCSLHDEPRPSCCCRRVMTNGQSPEQVLMVSYFGSQKNGHNCNNDTQEKNNCAWSP